MGLNPDINNAQRLSIIAMATTLIIVGVYDIYAVLFLPPGASVSEVVLSIARRHPILPLLVGVLIGHLFWPQM